MQRRLWRQNSRSLGILAMGLALVFVIAAGTVEAADSPTDSLGSARTQAAPASEPAGQGDTPPRRNIVRDLGRGLKGWGSDAWYVVSSPARLRKDGALWLGATLVASGVLYAYDQDLLDATRRNREEPGYRQIAEVGEFFEPVGFMGNTNVYYIGALGFGYAFRIKPLERIPAQILESHMIAGGLRNAAKILIGRRRPNEGRGPRAFEWNGGTSFPSGHASVVFEVATILSHHADRLPVTVAAYTIAGAVALQRVESGNHWPSDVLISAISGTLIARTVVRRNEERQVAVVPLVRPDGTVLLGLKRDF